ncbi:MAG TPA: hypothetical protein VH439_17240 [Gemmatimonadales bacterium]
MPNMRNDPTADTTWNARARSLLQGRTIKSVRYMEREEMDSFAWFERGLVLVLDNGTTLIIQADEEGNGPGAVWYDATGTQGVLPALR